MDPKPVYRKVISPWYDSEPLCIWVILMMLVVFLFACAGISVAGSHPVWDTYIWVPVLLAGLSMWVLFSISTRLIKRLMARRSSASGL